MQANRRVGSWRLMTALVLSSCLIIPASADASPAVPDKSANVRLIKHFAYESDAYDVFKGATDIAFEGRFAYVASGGGLHIYDVSRRVPRPLSFFRCPGAWPDIAVVRPGLVALAFFNNDGLCGPSWSGILLVDVSRPSQPRPRGAVETPDGAHTIAAHPDGRVVYASPGGLEPGRVSVVDVSNPDEPKLAQTLGAAVTGCHDVTFSFAARRELAFCAAGNSRITEIWDVSDPVMPEVVGRIVNPLAAFHHYAFATDNGKYLGLTDENFACTPGQGAVWLYDITRVDDPKLVSHFDMPVARLAADPMGRNPSECTAHNFNFVPGTYKMVLAWYGGGFNVIDFREPGSPVEIAHYVAPETSYWSAYFHSGRVFASDFDRGLDVFEIRGIDADVS